jgi:arylsulfatase A-like enzyme
LTRRTLLASALARPRNVVLILADDLGYGDLGCYGSTTNRTPNLDRLAADGLRLADYYTCSPVCSPARAGLLTGLAPERVGVTGVLREEHDHTGLDLAAPTMADHFRRRGFATALIGKWHLGMGDAYHPNRRGFDTFWGFLNGTLDYQTHLSTGGGGRGTRTTRDNGAPLAVEGYLPERLTERAVRWVEENASRPYFLLLAHPLPHVPLQVPDRWSAPYRPALDNHRAVYAGMLACLDDCVGQVRQALERTGQWDRTVVVFYSDNGWVTKGAQAAAGVGSNGPLRGGKYELFEGGIRVPCIVYWPGVTRPGSVSTDPVWSLDWMPTLCGSRGGDGIDIRRVLGGGKAPRGRTLRWRFEDRLVRTPPSFAARRGDWKFLRVGEERFLFNLRDDIGETRDRSAEFPALMRDLSAAGSGS